jgi:chorismate mutase
MVGVGVFAMALCLSATTAFAFMASHSTHTKKPLDRSGIVLQGSSGENSSKDVRTYDIFSLESIRATLIRQEETIIFALIERAQYRRNAVIYDPRHLKLRNVYGAPISFLEWMLIETEKLHSKVRRYASPEEHAFFPHFLENAILPKLEYPDILMNDSINVNSEIYRWYIQRILDRMCVPADDEQYGSSALCDISVLQALSRRVHYGKFVAESKFLSDPEKYTEYAKEGNTAAIITALTNSDVERKVIRRAFAKASTYGQDVTDTGETHLALKVEPMLIADIYRDMIIPLTKDVEVRYLYNRVGLTPPPPDTYFDLCRGPTDSFESSSVDSSKT